jgi:hypothetical protein
MVDTLPLRLGALRDVLSVQYVACPDPHDLSVSVQLDKALVDPFPGVAISGFVQAVEMGTFCGGMFSADMSHAEVTSGSVDQLGPAIDFRLSVRAIDPLAIRILIDELSFALGFRKILALRVWGGPHTAPDDSWRIGDRAVLEAMRSVSAYPTRGLRPRVPIDVDPTGMGFGIMVDCGALLDDEKVLQLEEALATWRGAVKRYLTADGDDPTLLPESLLARTGRTSRSFACAYRVFDSVSEPAVAALGNVLDRQAAEGVPILKTKVRA